MQGILVQSLVRKIPQAAGQLSQRATVIEPVYSGACAIRSLCSTTKETTAVGSLCVATRQSPCSPKLEKARAARAMKTQGSHKRKKKKKKKQGSICLD